MRESFVYPSLPSRYDLGLVRLGGAGLGNCFFVYFAAFVLSRRLGLPMVAPAWSHLRLAAMLRGDQDLRRYGLLVGPAPDELTGGARIAALARLLRGSRIIETGPAIAQEIAGSGEVSGQVAPLRPAPLRIVMGDYTFDGLVAHRDAVRARLLQISRRAHDAPDWGRQRYAAVHVRLGDFLVATEAREHRDGFNRRIGFHWYRGVIEALRRRYPALPIRIYSDGTDAELAPLLDIPDVSVRREGDALADLLGLAGASLLVGSNSTFSRWAAYFGNMPSIWRIRPGEGESPVSPLTPMVAIDDDFSLIDALPDGFAC